MSAWEVTVATATSYVNIHHAISRNCYEPSVYVCSYGRSKKEMRDARLRDVLRVLRDSHGSNAALARALKVEPPTVTEILNGKRGVGLEMIEAIADLTGRSLDDLCGRTATPFPGSLSSHVRWGSARVDAERMLAHVRPDALRAALDRVGSFALPEQPVALTGLFVARLAEAVISNPLEFQRSREK